MSPDPAAFHRALLPRPRGGRGGRHPEPSAAPAGYVPEAMLAPITVSLLAEDLAAWVLLAVAAATAPAGALLAPALPGRTAGRRGMVRVVVAAAGVAALLASAMMWGVSRHHTDLRDRLALAGQEWPLPTAVRAFVVLAAVDRPTVRAVTTARALRSTSLEVLSVMTDDQRAEAVREQWAALDLPVPLVELAVPAHDASWAVVEHVAAARRAEPHGLAVVYLPELTARRWWRRLFLGRGQARLRARLLALPGSAVTSVPWPIEES